MVLFALPYQDRGAPATQLLRIRNVSVRPIQLLWTVSSLRERTTVLAVMRSLRREKSRLSSQLNLLISIPQKCSQHINELRIGGRLSQLSSGDKFQGLTPHLIPAAANQNP